MGVELSLVMYIGRAVGVELSLVMYVGRAVGVELSYVGGAMGWSCQG